MFKSTYHPFATMGDLVSVKDELDVILNTDRLFVGKILPRGRKTIGFAFKVVLQISFTPEDVSEDTIRAQRTTSLKVIRATERADIGALNNNVGNLVTKDALFCIEKTFQFCTHIHSNISDLASHFSNISGRRHQHVVANG